MTKEQAKQIIGNQSRHCIFNMAIALSFHSWRNDSDDWRRLEAACVWLAPHAPRRARAILKAHKSQTSD